MLRHVHDAVEAPARGAIRSTSRSAWDPPGPTFREEKFAAYKETRPATPDDLRDQIPLRAGALRGAAPAAPGGAGLRGRRRAGHRGRPRRAISPIDLVLVTADKDMLQLVGPRVRVLSTTGRGGERVVFDEAAVKAKWGVEPAQIPDLLALMGDSIDNIPGVPGVGEKTAAKLIGQFGSVDAPLREPHAGAGQAARDAGRQPQAGAALARARDREHAGADRACDLEAFRRQEPDWDAAARALDRARVRQPAAPAPGASPRPRPPAARSPTLADAAALARVSGQGARGRARSPSSWVRRGWPAGPGARRRSASITRRRAPRSSTLEAAEAPRCPISAGGTLIGHDVKPLIEWWLARGGALPPVEDTAVAAYLLNPARTNYKLEEVCAELLGQGPGIARPGTRAAVDLGAVGDGAARAAGGRAPRALPGHRAAADRRCSRAWSATASAWTRCASASSRASSSVHLERTHPRDLRAGGRGVQHRLAQAARPHPVREAQAAAGAGGPRPATRPTPTCSSSSRSATSCPRKILEHRTLAKLKSTYADALPTLINPAHRAHPHLVQPARGRDRTARRRATRTSRTSRSAPSWAGASARRSCPSRAGGSSPRTTRRSSCASSPTSRARRA